jgi:hypothetical protein
VRTFPAGPDRARLGFLEEVMARFGFLEREYGMVQVRTETTFVRWESPAVFAQAYHGRSSYEIGFQVGLRRPDAPERETHYSIQEIMDVLGVREKEGFTEILADTAEEVREGVARIAGHVRRHARPALVGDPAFYERLQELQWERTKRYTKDAEGT